MAIYEQVNIHGVRTTLLEQQAAALALPVEFSTGEGVLRDERFCFCDLI
jgi:hypothetical protein